MGSRNLVEFYFDLETTGLDPKNDKIITIQWQMLNGFPCTPMEELNILKEWESSEKEILEEFLPLIHCENPWDFVIIGKNLMFDFNFLSNRAMMYGLKDLDLHYCHSHPFLDLKHVLVLINEGRFKGHHLIFDGSTGLDMIDIPHLYRDRRYPEIIEYIQKEAEAFIKGLRVLQREMPSLKRHFENL